MLTIYNPTTTTTILIRSPEGKEFRLNFVDGVLTSGGDLPMDEGAVIFFDEVKRIAALKEK